MTVTLKLDTASLRAMLEDNPEFKLELSKAVLNNIKSDIIESGVRGKIDAVLRDMTATTGHGAQRSWYNNEFKALLIKTIEQTVGQSITDAATNAVQSFLLTNGKRVIADYLQLILNEELDALITEDMVRKALNKKLSKALAQLTEE